jgi:uncharacterized protein (DUF2252 family)
MKKSKAAEQKKKEQPFIGQGRVFEKHPSRAESYAMGKALRETYPRIQHEKWKAPAGRPDPVHLLLESEKERLPDLLPLRHGRMAVSPFTFYRGSALNMAADLAKTPSSGIRVQCCGDAHLLNFGGFATPERRAILSINDLDETLPAFWEWDLKRLTTSFVVACRDNGLSESDARDAVLSCASAYRTRMAEFSEMGVMDLWYFAIDVDMILATIKDPDMRRRVIKRLSEERKKSIAENIFPKLAEGSGDFAVIKDQLPAIFHWEGHTPGQVVEGVKNAFLAYRANLSPAYQLLLDRFQLRDAAIKVVGIGSVGTACWILLLTDGDGNPFFLQVKEARASVLEAYAGKSVYSNHGQRVVNGYRIMQPFSDIFLGWTKGELGREFFIRQLRDMKVSFRVETFGKTEMNIVAGWCGWALALSHARSGNAAMMSGYMGKSDVLDQALANFSVAYANQNEKDYAVFKRAIKSGKIKAAEETAR